MGSPKNNYQTNCTLSLSLKNNTRPKKFTNRLTISEGFYNIHTNFQAFHPMQILPILSKKIEQLKKMSIIPPLCSFKLLFGLKSLLNVKNCQFFGEKKKHQLSFFGGVIRFTLHT